MGFGQDEPDDLHAVLHGSLQTETVVQGLQNGDAGRFLRSGRKVHGGGNFHVQIGLMTEQSAEIGMEAFCRSAVGTQGENGKIQATRQATQMQTTVLKTVECLVWSAPENPFRA